MKRYSILYGRIVYSLIIIFVYLIGRSIPIPWDAAEAAQSATGLSALFGGILGGSAEFTLFSLGLTPWIVATIVVQALNPLIRNFPGDEASVRGRLTAGFTLLLAVVLAVIQVQGTEFLPEQGLPDLAQRAAAVIFLTAGSFCVVWLSRRNEEWGIGGQRLLIVVNLIDTLQSSANSLREETTLSLWGRDGSVSVIVLLLLLLIVAVVTGYFQVKENQYPVHRLMIDSRYVGKDYLPIRYNPAGTMPVMYVMALFSMLSSLASAYAAALPTDSSDALLRALNLSSLPGAVLFLLLFRILTELSAAITIDPVNTADDLKRSGGYIEGVHPGKKTEKFLRGKIRHASNLSSAVMGLILILPYAYGLLVAGTEEIGEIAVSIIFLTGILIELAGECAMYYSMQDYRPILGMEYQEESGQDMENETEPEAKDVDMRRRGEERTGAQESRADDSAPAAKEEKASSEHEREDTDVTESGQEPENASTVPAEGETDRVSASASPDSAGTQESRTYYFVPAWDEDHTLSDPGDVIAPAAPVYDDIVHQMKMFHSAGEQAEMIGLAYLPQLRHFLLQYGLEDMPYWSVYDELQGIDPERPTNVLRWQDPDREQLGLKGQHGDLNWVPENGVMHGFEKGHRIFDVHLTKDGSIYYIDHYDGEDDALWVDRRSIYDDRGFLSSSIEYRKSDAIQDKGNRPGTAERSSDAAGLIPGVPGTPVIQRFYNADGKEQFRITYPGRQVEFNKDSDGCSVNGTQYENVSKMPEDRINAFLKKCKEKDVFFLAAQGEADDIVRRAGNYAQGGRKVILSFYEGRYAQLEGKGAGDPTEGSDYAGDREGEAIRQYKSVASMIFVDSKTKKEYFGRFEYGDFGKDQFKRRIVPVEDVCPFEMKSRTGRSAAAAQDVIFMPADELFDDGLHGRTNDIMRHIEYLMKEDSNIHLWLGTKTGSVKDFDGKRRKWLRKYRKYKAQNAVNLLNAEEGWAWQDETGLAGEEQKVRTDARNDAWRRKNNELEAMHRRIRVVSFRTGKELEDILEAARLVLDPRKTPDLWLQTAAICYGIPQVVLASSGYVLHTENGYICSGDQYIVDGLHYYLDGLANWNRAHEACAHIIRQYSVDDKQRVDQWKRRIEEGENGQ